MSPNLTYFTFPPATSEIWRLQQPRMMGSKISGGGTRGWTGVDGKEDGLWEERGGAGKQVDQLHQVERSSRRPTALISGCEACPRRPTTLLPQHYPSTTLLPQHYSATPHPALPLTANYRISLDRAPKCRPLFARGGVSTCRAISIIISTNKGVTVELTPDYPTSVIRPRQ